jgi:hypothetical protein
MQSNFPGENMTISGQPVKGVVGEGMLMRARCFPNIKQLPSARRSTEEFPK